MGHRGCLPEIDHHQRAPQCISATLQKESDSSARCNRFREEKSMRSAPPAPIMPTIAPSDSKYPPPAPTASSPTFIKKHAVLTYFALVFALSWGAMLLLTGGLGPIGSTDPRFLFIALTAPVAPAVVGLLLTGLVGGRAGYRDMLARLLRWRVGVRWYAVALLTAPLLTLAAAALLALALRSTEFLPAILTTPDPLGLLLPGVVRSEERRVG